ncbi:MAG: CheY chemotaxis protein or a CheY-like (Receiver) domain, partial [Spirosoma sp.]|nr:CheY chemotaxis protein or a CheY-like (Receiver) domain [Spirosoma sp.]
MLLANQQQIPIIVMSSSVAEDDVRRAYQLGARFYIVKPLA